MFAQQSQQFGDMVSPMAAHSFNAKFNADEQHMSDLVGGNVPWSCEKCTFVNEPSELHCVICFYARFEVKNLDAQWQWKAADRVESIFNFHSLKTIMLH